MQTRHLARTAFTVHLAATLMGLTAHGAVYYVDGATGNDAFPGVSWPLAKQSVAGALAVATSAESRHDAVSNRTRRISYVASHMRRCHGDRGLQGCGF